MSEDSKAQGPGLSFADIAAGIVEDCLYNIIHDIVLQTHREEKLQRMQSAATTAEQAAIAEHQENTDKATAKGTSAPPVGGGGGGGDAAPATSVRIDTGAAAYDNGRVTLRGNPLKTVPEIVCPHCKLPRLKHPIAGVGSRLPDLSKNYCTRHPFVSRQGHDIYNNPFPTDMAKTKKERELIKRQEKDNTPSAGGGGSAGGGSQQGDDSQENSLSKLAAGGKPASYIPWHTCPNCKRSLLITRFAQHAEKCLGISGRQSSRNAMAKLSSSQGAASAAAGNTPLGSRVGTPNPGSQAGKLGSSRKEAAAAAAAAAAGDGDGDDDGGGDTPKKIKKKSSYVKKADRDRGDRDRDRDRDGDGERREKGGTKILKLKTGGSGGGGAGGSSSKRPPKEDRDRKEGTPMSGAGGSKRDRERDGDGGGDEPVPRKKLKLFKTESNASDLTDRDAKESVSSSTTTKKKLTTSMTTAATTTTEDQSATAGSPASTAS
ncbi:transcriptional activator [Diplodia corticola]|uniref:SAGA-associated factor 11 n=1 Tax=Diplodia corticola TaxID=236234 RepID=A0A1J9S4T1_9PEZI|nr:transcriptional activator [Diplodia corticola]OJD35535.1 transcriptional activator [Diplodia corticola]